MEIVKRDSKNEELVIQSEVNVDFEEEKEKETICSICFEEESETEVLYPQTCGCEGSVHEKCLEGRRKKWRFRYYVNKCNNKSNKDFIYSEMFCGVNRFLTFSIHQIVHREWIHPFLPYRRCNECNQLYDVVSYSSSSPSSKRKNIFCSIFGEGKISIFLLILQFNVIDPIIIFSFCLFVIPGSIIDLDIFLFLKTILISIFIAIPCHYLATILFLNLYNRTLCHYYKPQKIGFKHAFMELYRRSRKGGVKRSQSSNDNINSDLDFETHTFGTCEDLIVRIFTYLTVKELLGNVSLVCRHFHVIINFPQNCNDLKTLKVIERFYGMHNELWKSFLVEKTFSNFEKNMFQKSIQEGEIVSFRDVYISNLMEMTSCGNCSLCIKPITVKDKWDNNYVSGHCGRCRPEIVVHRNCLDYRRQINSIRVNIVSVVRIRFWNFVNYYCNCCWRSKKKYFNHNDEVHRDMWYRKCPLCSGYLTNLRLKKGRCVSTPLIYSIFASLGWSLLAFLEISVCLHYFTKTYKLGKAIWIEGWVDGWESECGRIIVHHLGEAKNSSYFWLKNIFLALFVDVLLFRVCPIIAFFLFYLICVVFTNDTIGDSYAKMMVNSYSVERLEEYDKKEKKD